MPLVLSNRVQETATANTTVSFTLTGAVAGFQTFATIGNTNTTYYSATDASGNWEVGLGTYSTTGPTLTRTTVYASSNAGLAVTFSGTVNVFVTLPSGSAVYEDASGNVSALGIISSGTWQATTVGVAYGGTGVTASSGANSVVLRDASQNITINRLNQGLQTITASGGTTVLTVASQFNQALVGTGGHTFQLPDATTLSDTTAFQFNNNATGTLTIINNSGGAVGTIAAGGAAGVALLSNATVPGTWDVHAYIPENVTWGANALALGGTVITGGTWNGGTVTPAYGGTGLTTFTAANNALYSTAAGALAAGTLPVAAGGTGVTTSTGSGNVVLSTSPTLVTPVLGTPTSGNFSTGTFTWPTFNQNTTGTAANVTGTVAFANGGTGATTRQDAMDALAGAVTAGAYLRGNGTDVVMSGIQAGDVPTLNQNTTGTAANVTGVVGVLQGGTGQSSYTDGQLLIGNTSTNLLTKATLSAGTGITITNGAGSITIASTVSGGVTSVTGTAPVNSSGGTTPAISLAASYGDTQNPYASKAANFVLAAPSGAAGVPTFRAVVAADIPTLNQNTTGSAGSVTNAATFNNGGTGGASGSTFNGSSALTVSYNTVGAPSTTGTGASGSWGISVTGTSANVTGTVAIGNGGTGATTRQDAMDALAGAVTSGQYLRGNGTDVVMSAIQAADVPTLNQNTTGSSGSCTGNAATATSATTAGSATTATTATNVSGGTVSSSRVNPRTSTTTSTAAISPDIASFDQYAVTAQAVGLTINAPTGTPVDGNKLMFRLLDNGTARALTWNATYTVIGVTLPTTTVINKTTYVGCIYNANNTRWDVIAVTTQA
ncbi:hypothetical protein UFOVP652_75 [uncultured Caudovirales phage]|uniref:Uncharacterized protein n=1 Tax=uncultured Caudovirales phage TaxID=2100421 RepID=A0A6J7X1A9_9CAUD|nr:hypothetical protein UFOVP652_75 [uncultured Caudovirales phage]CAB5224304.1 hypothetical protein UFOVP734_49 [uncultured Caudovirales phage]